MKDRIKTIQDLQKLLLIVFGIIVPLMLALLFIS
jgi:hypothetical protein